MDDQALLDCLIAVDQPLLSMPDVNLSEGEAASIRHGQQLTLENTLSGTVRMYNEQTFLGLGEMSLDGTLAPKKLFNLV
jgi:tRNA pseudouridine55 synthase